MVKDDYKSELEMLALKIDKNTYLKDEILSARKHNMFIEGGECQKLFQHTFDAVEDEFACLEKVDLIDFWNLENERRNQTW